MTLEQSEGTEPTEQTAVQEGPAADTKTGTQSRATAAEAETPANEADEQTASAVTQTEDDQPSPTAAEQAAPADDTAAEPEGPASTADVVHDRPGTDAQPDEPVGTSDPSPEAAVGASGARPLGDAAAISARAAEATAEATAEPVEDRAGDEGTSVPPAPSASETQPLAEARSAAPVAVATREGPEPTTMEELLNEQPGDIRSLKHGDVVEGTVVRIDKDEILVDIGAKSEGVVSNRELYGRNAEVQPELNIGDTVLVYVLQPESQEGHAVLSLRRAGLERKWRSMQEQFDAGLIIEAPVIDHNKGGLIVDCGIRGFVPISQIVDFPRRPQNEQPRDAAQEIAEKLQPYVGRKLRLKILEVNRKANRLILSEKVALYEERREKRDELFSSLQVGQRVSGTVRSIAPFGVFIDLGGIDGLVHKSELSWNKVNNPEAGYKVGEEVEAEVIDINHERGRISLSIRRLQPDPWHSSVADMKVGDVIDGTVTKIVNFGAFVRVRDGLEGLIHISELSHQRVAHPGDVVHEGQRLKLKVISLDSERHRLGLSLKQAEEAPARPPERERRRREERAYDPAQAVQEPEGGIDNTLAAAFAQVRQQMEDTQAARQTGPEEAAPVYERPAEEPGAPVVETAPAAEAEAEDVEPTAVAEESLRPIEELAPEVLAEQPAAEEPQPQTASAPALEVGAAEPASEAPEPPAETADAEAAGGEPSESDEPEAAKHESGEPVADTSAEPAEGAPDVPLEQTEQTETDRPSS
ncbi:MAG: 30S ribosomal protein S1 [Chloroflexota bacterium]|nr:30S ribosomal protein S1 [Chloroflexota bacterium]